MPVSCKHHLRVAWYLRWQYMVEVPKLFECSNCFIIYKYHRFCKTVFHTICCQTSHFFPPPTGEFWLTGYELFSDLPRTTFQLLFVSMRRSYWTKQTTWYEMDRWSCDGNSRVVQFDICRPILSTTKQKQLNFQAFTFKCNQCTFQFPERLTFYFSIWGLGSSSVREWKWNYYYYY